jgi:hypothetical protein
VLPLSPWRAVVTDDHHHNGEYSVPLSIIRRTGLLSLGVPAALLAQAPAAKPSDVESPEAVARATYETVSRKPGEPFQWDRFRSLFLPGARLIPNEEQTQNTFTPHTVDSFISLIDEPGSGSESADPTIEGSLRVRSRPWSSSMGTSRTC